LRPHATVVGRDLGGLDPLWTLEKTTADRGSTLASLPPEDSPVWDRMEEDIAAGRWPVPSLLGGLGFWYRGSSNELHRRTSFRRQLTRRLEWSSWVWMGPLWGLFAVAWLWIFLTEAHPQRFHLYNSIVHAIMAFMIVVGELAFRHQFDQSYQRYFGRREPPSAV
jgi:hypothetical protein